MSKQFDNWTIVLVNFIWLIPSILWCQHIVRHLSVPLSFLFLYYFLFYCLLSATYIIYRFRNKKSVFFSALFGLISGAIIGTFSFSVAELLTSENITFILDNYHQFGLISLISDNFTRAGMLSLHFIISLFSAITCFLLIERWVKKREHI